MAQPKKKSSKRRQGLRRKTHKEQEAHLIVCKTCGKKTLPHSVCKYCETYNK